MKSSSSLLFLLLSLNFILPSFCHPTEAVVSEAGGQELECRDLAAEGEVACREWAWHGECTKTPSYMESNCRKSCGLCTPNNPPVCEDAYPTCSQWASRGMCSGYWEGKKGEFTIDAPFVVEMCPRSCGVCNIHLDERDWKLGMGFPQTAPELTDPVDDLHIKQRLKAKVAETAAYILSLPADIRPVCKFGHVNCARFALNPDSCPSNKGHYVYDYLCAAACKTCEKFANVEERETAQEYFDDALAEIQRYIDYKKLKAQKEAMEAADY